MRVTTADFIKNYGQFADRALSEPVIITKNGRDRLIVVSVEEYERLKRHDASAARTEGPTKEDLALIEEARVPPR